jgi:PBP1b-binding outer membrane lipoprotein LpoB
MKSAYWLAALAALTLTGCATTYNSAAETTTTVESTTTTVVQGDFNDLLAQMRDRFARLAEQMSTNERAGARRTLEEIEALWSAMQQDAQDRGRQFAEDLRRIVDFATTSVTRNRPADADKGLRFIDLFISAEATQQ